MDPVTAVVASEGLSKAAIASIAAAVALLVGFGAGFGAGRYYFGPDLSAKVTELETKLAATEKLDSASVTSKAADLIEEIKANMSNAKKAAA